MFVVTNLVIAVIVENIFLIAKDYDWRQDQIEIRRMRDEFDELKAMFLVVSEDDRSFEFQEFWQSINGRDKLGARFRSKFKSLGFSPDEVMSVKKLILADEIKKEALGGADVDDEIDIELFVYCLKKIKSLASAQDALILAKQITVVEQKMTAIEIYGNIILESLDEL